MALAGQAVEQAAVVEDQPRARLAADVAEQPGHVLGESLVLGLQRAWPGGVAAVALGVDADVAEIEPAQVGHEVLFRASRSRRGGTAPPDNSRPGGSSSASFIQFCFTGPALSAAAQRAAGLRAVSITRGTRSDRAGTRARAFSRHHLWTGCDRAPPGYALGGTSVWQQGIILPPGSRTASAFFPIARCIAACQVGGAVGDGDAGLLQGGDLVRRPCRGRRR